MSHHGRTRREALRDIVATVAAAAGLSALEADALLAQMKKTADLKHLAGIKPTNDTVKALKVLLAPKAQAAQVFQSEFGKMPATALTMDPDTKKPICPAYLGSGGACSDLGCGVVVCNSLGCTGLGGMDLGAKQHLAKAPEKAAARPSAAPVAKKPQFGPDPGAAAGGCKSDATCGCQTKWFNINLGDVQSQWLREVQTDPYIVGLMKEFDVKTPEALETELVKVLGQRRAGM
ncbi:MAG: hypothetical protein H6511_05525 [Holophagales bacterium]|nr:hypothetical protein [Holophagales bacterium]